MWLRYLKNTPVHKPGDIVWTDEDNIGQKEIDDGLATRCLGPDGLSFGEATPEDIEAQLKAEEARKKKVTIKTSIKKVSKKKK